MMTDNSYKVYITCLDRDKYGNPTKDYILAKLLYKKLEKGNPYIFDLEMRSRRQKRSYLHFTRPDCLRSFGGNDSGG